MGNVLNTFARGGQFPPIHGGDSILLSPLGRHNEVYESEKNANLALGVSLGSGITLTTTKLILHDVTHTTFYTIHPLLHNKDAFFNIERQEEVLLTPFPSF